MSTLRAVGRVAGLLATAAVILPLQALVAGPLLHDYTTLPQLASKSALRIAGIKTTFNGAAIEKKEATLNAFAPHQSYLDAPLMMSFLPVSMVCHDGVKKGTGFLGRLLEKIVSSAGTIYVTRDAQGKYIPEAQEQVAAALNQGRSVAFSPEGLTTDGTSLTKFKYGVMSVTTDNLSKTKLDKRVLVQAFVPNVVRVDGQSVGENPKLRDTYAWYGDQNALKHLWNVLQTKSIEIEVTALPVMDADDYPDFETFGETLREKMLQLVNPPAPSV